MKELNQLDRYKIIELLGEGAFAQVYRAEDTILQRPVAIKILKPRLVTDREAFERFIREGRVAAQLFHTHIATVLDIGEAEGQYYMAMRFVEGYSLANILSDQTALSWEQVRTYIQQVGSALHFAHRRDLVHRDIKPQNILISPDEGAVLTDFGLVRALQASGMTATGSMLGTPGYIAPEIWDGQPASPASDQYSLACVLVEMLTRQPLFKGATPAIMKQHLLEQPKLPQKYPVEAPDDLPDILLRALGKDPDERFADVEAFIGSLLPVADSEPSSDMLRYEDLVELVSNMKREKQQVEKPSVKSVIQIADTENDLVLKLAENVEISFKRVPAGEFVMGTKKYWEDRDARPEHQVYLDEYWIGATPVTNLQFQVFTMDTNHPSPKHWEGTQIPKELEDHPVVNVSWQDANAFCEWASKVCIQEIRLPSEAEWEKAARGTNGRRYSWGSEKPSKELCNAISRLGNTTPVGLYSPAGDSPYGCIDMIGNVGEMTSSLFKKYPYKLNDGRENRSANGKRVAKGGSFQSFDNELLCIFRAYVQRQNQIFNNLGFRCAVTI